MNQNLINVNEYIITK